MSLQSDTLPDDIDALKRLVIEQRSQLARERRESAYLREQLNLLLAKRFGPSSEKVPAEQFGLFNEAEQDAVTAESSAQDSVSVPAHQRKKPGRKPLPDFLPRLELIHDIPEAHKQCPSGCGEMRRIGEDIPERLAQAKSYLWAQKGEPPARPVILYDYDPSCSQSVAQRLLAGYTGYLRYVFTELPKANSVEDFERLLPFNVTTGQLSSV